MLLFLSDLHLTDTADRSTIDLTRLAEKLEGEIRQAVEKKGVEEIKLVLLGDVFELLKSKIWLDRNLRPWELATAAHVQAVDEVLAAIIQANSPFLTDLRRLTEDFPVKLVYLPGNHDLYLNTEMGVSARQRFEKLLPLPQNGGKPFETVLLDPAYSVMAKHGHEWDPTNRYGEHTAAIGDAVVLEVLLRIPTLVAAALKIPETDPRLFFLHELDNVRPQHPRALAYWLLAGLDGLGSIAAGARRALDEGFQSIARDLIDLTGQERFESTREIRWWKKFLLQTSSALLKKPGLLRLAVRLPWGGNRPSSYRQDALRDLEDALTLGGDLRYALCGHTHLPELVPMETSRGGLPCLYINTGTWRRVHRLSEVAFRRAPRTFSTWQEECLVCLYSLEERRSGLPSYEILRFASGRID